MCNVVAKFRLLLAGSAGGVLGVVALSSSTGADPRQAKSSPTCRGGLSCTIVLLVVVDEDDLVGELVAKSPWSGWRR